MPEPSHEIQLTYRPRDGPRRRVTFEPDPSVDGWEYQYWRIEEVYESTEGYWREVGREHVDAPTLSIDAEEPAQEAIADA